MYTGHSKAFDKVNFYVLFNKLMNRNIPRCVIEVLFDWLSESYIIVKWLNSLSSCYLVESGVR